MKRATLISLIDVVAFIAFLFLTSTGIVLHYMLPPGSGRWAEVWGMNRHQWGALHFGISILFFAVLTLHLLQHWRFVLGLFRGRLKACMQLRIALGLVGLAAVTSLSIAPLFSPVQTEGEHLERPHRGDGHGRPPSAENHGES